MTLLGTAWVSPIEIPDPGDGGIIDVSGSGYVNLKTSGNETRVVPRPQFIGQILQFHLSEGGSLGNVSLQFSVNFNLIVSPQGNTFAIGVQGDYAIFIGCYDGTNLLWRIVWRSGGAISRT